MFLRPEPELGWLPTHVQVTILQARGLRAKGKHGTSDAYTLIQVGREKYSTSVVEKTTGSPEWKEECSFELSPGAVERGENCELQLIVMHRALIGMDQFLGKVSIPLQEVYQEGRSQRNQWYKLRSKPGKKEKERGEIQVSIQFTRNNLTASMFDLSIKDKPKTPFGKLKDKLKVKKLSQMESSSAIVPSSIGRLDSDEEDEKKPKSKAAAFFKGRLRKSSLTRSNTSLGSDSTVSSTSGTIPTSAGISIVLPDVVKKPASRNSSLSNEPTVKDHEASPRMKHKRAFSDEVSQLKLFPEPKSVQNLKPKGSPISKSSLCINGSHVYTEVPSPKPVHSLEKSSSASMSFQNIGKKAEEVTEVIRGPSHSSEKLEHKPTGPTAEGQNVSSKPLPQPKPTNDPVRVETKPVQITTPMVFSEDVSKNKSQEAKAKEEKPKIGLQPGIGKNDPGNKSLTEPNPNVATSSEERGKVGSWFGSKDAKETQQKPSLDVSPQVETSSSASSHYSQCLFAQPTSLLDASALPRTNLHRASPSGVFGSLSASNPFLNSLQSNPFFEDLLSDRLLNTSPTHFFSSFPSGSIATSEAAEWGSSLVEEHSPLTSFCSTEDMNLYSLQGKSGNFEVAVDHPELRSTHSSSSEPPMFTGWEEQFDALASSRLQPSSSSYQQSPEPEDPNITSASKNNPLSSFGKLETMTGMLTPPDGNECHILKSNNSNFDTCWPDILKNDAKKSSELEPSPLLTNFSPTNIPSTRLMGLKEYNFSTETCKDQNTFNHSCQHVDTPLPASVQSLLQMGQNIVGVEEIVRQESPILTKETVAMALIGEHVLEVAESGIDVYSTQVSKEAVEQFSTVHNPERIRDEPEVMVTEKVEGIIKEQAISVNVGSVAPPKPPRLMLSSSVEQIETEDYNYQQTSHQDTTGKQMENPEEHMQEQNMGVSKQMVSPVACCPVIEIRSPVLEAFTEDTESTTEGLLTNLREENNDLGALNGEHLLDVNEVTPTEQFRTCPSSVSLGTDLSSVHEGSDKLELINRSSPKPFNLTLGDTKQNHNDFNFQKPMPLSKIQKGSRSELSSLSKKGDQSDFLFWSALEEQIPSRMIELGTKQNVPRSQGDIALSDGRNVSNMNTGERTEPEQNNNGDVLVLMGVESNSPPPIELQDARLNYESKALGDDSQHGYSLSQQSSWSADIIVDFKNEDFWRTNSDQLDQNHVENLPSPGNPFTPVDRTPLSHKNPFTVERLQSSQSSECSLQEDTSFKDLHAHAAIRNFPSAVPPSDIDMKAPYLHGSPPLAFSTPSLAIAPNPKPSNFPSPIMLLTTSGATTTTNTHTATLSGLLSPVAGGVTTAAPPILPLETQTADNPFMPLKTSPHPVKPISATHSESTAEKKTQRPAITTALSSGLEKLKSVTGGQNATPKKQEQERLKDLCLPDQAAKYYHLTHDELIQMLLQREAELSKKDNHVRELEEYIDKLLVRIMDQAPALLQAPLEMKK